MTDFERKDAMKQELFDQTETAREAVEQAKRTLDRAQQREQELQQELRTGITELRKLEHAIDVGGEDSIDASSQWPSKARALQDAEDQLALLQKNTVPKLRTKYDDAVLQYELQASLAGGNGYLSADEAEDLIDDALQQMHEIIQDTLRQLQASDCEAQSMATAVNRAEGQGLVDTMPHDAPLRFAGTGINRRLYVNGELVNRNRALEFKTAVAKVYENAQRTLNA